MQGRAWRDVSWPVKCVRDVERGDGGSCTVADGKASRFRNARGVKHISIWAAGQRLR